MQNSEVVEFSRVEGMQTQAFVALRTLLAVVLQERQFVLEVPLQVRQVK